MKTGAPILLVNMPYGYLPAPSIALGLLKARLEQASLATEVRYANIEFAKRVGPGFYSRLAGKYWALLGEWSFAESAFPEFEPDHDAYLQTVMSIAASVDPAAAERRCRAAREAASRFIEELAQEIVERRPRILGCSSVFQQHTASLALLRRVKELAPHVVTMIGGANCEGEMGRSTLLSFPWLDVVVSGEADDLIVPLCERLLENGAHLEVEEAPVGVFGSGHRERWAKGEELAASRAIVSDLDGLPIPDYDDYFSTLDRSGVVSAVIPALLVETSRGCWWGARSHCTFCGLNGESMGFRSKSADRAYDELQYLSERHGVDRFSVVDNILDLAYFDDLFPRLAEEQPGWTLFYEVKANLSKERLELLRAAGVEWIQPGLEAIHDGPLSLMAKGTSAAINIQTLKWARTFGINCAWSILIGLPGEKDEWFDSMTEIVDSLVHLQAPMGWNVVIFDRFSPYHNQSARFGLDLEATWPHFWVYPLDGEQMKGLAYRFQDRGPPRALTECRPGEARRPRLLEVPGMSRFFDAIQRWRGLFWDHLPPILAVEDLGDSSVILDTRPCAVEQTVTLRGLHHLVHQQCDRAVTLEGLHRAVQSAEGREISRDDVSAALEELIERKLILAVSGRYLALAVEGDIPTLDGMRHFPGGHVELARDHRLAASPDPPALRPAASDSARAGVP